jgi:uncharacterized protein (DUF2147 family)
MTGLTESTRRLGTRLMMTLAAVSIVLGSNIPAVYAQTTAETTAASSPVGVWQTIDDRTGQPKALVQISQMPDGTLSGKVLTGLGAEHDPLRRCTACTDARKDQLVQGMVILSGLKPDGDHWDGGEILDPENGKLYKCKLHIENQGLSLVVRGYIGFSLIGRSQTWRRDTGTPKAE